MLQECNAQLIAPAVTAISAVIALIAFLFNRKTQREALVQKAYYDYIKMAVDRPELAFPLRQAFDFEKQTLDGGETDFERYEWFLSAMLVTVHFVMRIRGRNKLWKKLTTNQISYHWQYLEHFWNRKPFIVNWRTDLEEQMLEGIKMGKEKFEPKEIPK